MADEDEIPKIPNFKFGTSQRTENFDICTPSISPRDLIDDPMVSFRANIMAATRPKVLDFSQPQMGITLTDSFPLGEDAGAAATWGSWFGGLFSSTEIASTPGTYACYVRIPIIHGNCLPDPFQASSTADYDGYTMMHTLAILDKDIINAGILSVVRTTPVKVLFTDKNLKYARIVSVDAPIDANMVLPPGARDSHAAGTPSRMGSTEITAYDEKVDDCADNGLIGSVDNQPVGNTYHAMNDFFDNASWPCPPDSPITSPTCPRLPPKDGASRNHGGTDIGVPTGTPVFAAADGIVKLALFAPGEVGYSEKAGNFISIYHPNPNLPNGGQEPVKLETNYRDALYTRYLHLSEVHVKKGDTVTAGQGIGKSGNTGGSTGPHLHYEIKRGGWKYGQGGTIIAGFRAAAQPNTSLPHCKPYPGDDPSVAPGTSDTTPSAEELIAAIEAEEAEYAAITSESV